MKKSQSSLEFLMIFGIAFSIILVLGGIFFGYFSGEKETLNRKHLENIGLEMMSNIEKIYFLGTGNRVTMDTKFPEGIENLTIVHASNIVNGETISFDYLNFTYIYEGQVNFAIFTPHETYIRFNCTRCHHDTVNNLSYYNDTSDFSSGFKKIRFDSRGNWVNVNFIKGDEHCKDEPSLC